MGDNGMPQSQKSQGTPQRLLEKDAFFILPFCTLPETPNYKLRDPKPEILHKELEPEYGNIVYRDFLGAVFPYSPLRSSK